MHLIALGILAIVLGVIAVITHLIHAFNELNHPCRGPGPTLIPYLGRIHDLPIRYMWLKLKDWADEYGTGGFYRTEMLGTHFLVVTDEKLAEQLLVKKAKYNSDRPAVQSLFDSKSTHGSMEYLPLMGKNGDHSDQAVDTRHRSSDKTTEYWARQRKLTHAYLTEAANAHYHGIMDFEAKRWLDQLLQRPDAFATSLEDMTARVMCTLTWDDPSHSEYLTQSAWGLLTQMSPAGPITNLATPLWHLPLCINPWKRAERERHDEQQAWWMDRLRGARSMLKKGHLRQCWTKQYLEKTAVRPVLSGDYEASCVLGMLPLVGVFTVVGPLSYWLVAMIHHPEWQTAVQREVDEKCAGRMPTLKDGPKLPILRATIKETMRWKPNVPTGVAHETEADDVFNGIFIPKGTRILPLDFAFLRNPKKYPDPEGYRPERWLEPGWPTYQEPLTRYPTIKGMTSFGWGQRQCLGMNLTQDELIVACGALAWCFTLKPKWDPVKGCNKPVPLDKCNSLLIIKPDPFEMAFEPRSEERKRQAQMQWDDANMEDQQERAVFFQECESRLDRLPKLEASVPSHGAGLSDGQEDDDVIVDISPVSRAGSQPP